MTERKEVRCFCARTPLLAVYGVGEDGEPFLHVKVYKQSRIYAELYIDGDAKCRITCRECLRVHSIRIITNATQAAILKRKVVDDYAPITRRA